MVNKRVIVAMSGGVDSSVSAYLLKSKGYDVIGIFIRFWSPDDKKKSLCSHENLCCSAEARNVAEKTARLLDIPFYVLDARDFFKEKVVDPFMDEYSRGRTPNPCVSCGKYIKFDFLHNKARSLFDAQYIVTGHYARVEKKARGYCLLKGKDKKKDQSYFLYTASQKELSSFIFPLGGMTKPQVRKIAEKAKLPSYKRPESQEICFVPNNDYADFLKKYSKNVCRKGWIIDKDHKKIKEHDGIQGFTIGQRKGLGVSGKKPYYVVSIDAKKNEVMIGSERDLYAKELYIKNVNWVFGKEPKDGSIFDVKIRYAMNPAKAKICYKDSAVRLVFLKSVRAVTPGQSAVLYKGDILFGGGIIK